MSVYVGRLSGHPGVHDVCSQSVFSNVAGGWVIGSLVLMCLMLKGIVVLNLVRNGIERLGSSAWHILVMCLPALILLACSAECWWHELDTVGGFRWSLLLHVADALLQALLSSKAAVYLYRTGRIWDIGQLVLSCLSFGPSTGIC